MIQDDDLSTGPADASHFVHDADRIGDDADHVRRVDDIERAVGELQVAGIHLQQANAADALARGALARLLEHRTREVDPGDRTGLGIERKVDAGAHANLEHALARLNVHSLDRLQAARVQRRAEGEIVDLGELVVDAFDEIVLDGGD